MAGFDPVLTPRHGELDELHRGGRYVKSQQGAVFALQKKHFCFLFRTLRLKMTALF